MAKTMYFTNTHTGARYQVLRKFRDAEGVEKIELKGKAATFVEPYNKERFKKMGYTLEVEEVDDDE